MITAKEFLQLLKEGKWRTFLIWRPKRKRRKARVHVVKSVYKGGDVKHG